MEVIETGTYSISGTVINSGGNNKIEEDGFTKIERVIKR